MGRLFNQDTGQKSLFGLTKATPFLYAHLKCDEGSGDVLNDSSGNGRHLTWNPTGTNATATAAGVWTVNGLEYGAGTVAGDCFGAADSTLYRFDDQSKTSIIVVQFTPTLSPVSNTSIICGRGVSGGDSDAGWQLYFSATDDATNILHNGTSQVSSVTTNGAHTISEKATVMYCHEGPLKRVSIYHCSDTTFTQFATKTPSTGALTINTSASTQRICIGQRSYTQASELTTNMIIHNIRFYQDDSAGDLPENLGDIVRWLHENPEQNIPADWWY